MNKFTKEWTNNDINVEECISIDYNNDSCQPNWTDMSESAMHLEFSFETWFDVDAKFGTHTSDDDSTWVNLFVYYDPDNDQLFIEYQIDSIVNSYYDYYQPTQSERELVIHKIEDWCMKNYNMSAKELVDKTRQEDLS